MVDTTLNHPRTLPDRNGTIMAADTTGAVPSTVKTEGALTAETGTTSPADGHAAGGGHPPTGRKFAAWWWILAVVSVAAAAALSVAVARGTELTTAHRAAAAWVALLVVMALAVSAQAVLLWYQSRTGGAPGRKEAGKTIAFRRRGLKAAVMG